MPVLLLLWGEILKRTESNPYQKTEYHKSLKRKKIMLFSLFLLTIFLNFLLFIFYVITQPIQKTNLFKSYLSLLNLLYFKSWLVLEILWAFLVMFCSLNFIDQMRSTKSTYVTPIFLNLFSSTFTNGFSFFTPLISFWTLMFCFI